MDNKLAGFDLIIEIARMAIERELLNTPLPSGPNGPLNDTLVPPFLLSRSISLPGFTGLLTLKVTELNLRARARTSLLTLNFSFEECSFEAPRASVSMLVGQGTVTAPLYFTPKTLNGGAPLPLSYLVLDFTQSSSSLQLDLASINRLDQALGASLGGMIRSMLATTVTDLFKKQGVVNLNFSFAIDSFRDSTNMMTLTAVPSVSWIDDESLGIFGYHRQFANTGNFAWKTTSDLPPAPYPSFPWYPVAVLISPSSFKQLVACPAIRSSARDHISDRHREAFIDEARAHNQNVGSATNDEIASAENLLRVYLDSPAGQAEIASVTPAPCGNGQMDQRIKMPDPFSDSTGYIDWLSMDLGEGKIDVRAHAHADVFCGKVSVDVPMWLHPYIGRDDNTIYPGQVQKGEPSSDVDADLLCAIPIAVASAFLVGAFTGSVIALIAVAVAESLAEGLVNKEILKQDLTDPNFSKPELPTKVRLHTISVTPSGLIIQGEWEGNVIDPHKFDPSVHLYSTTTHAESTTVKLAPGLFEATCLGGGEPRTFHYVPHAWDTSVKYYFDIGDVPRPLRYGDWFLTHDGVSHKLIAGVLAFPGKVLVPDPTGKEMLQARDKIIIVVQGNNEDGYTLIFRAEDINVPYKLETRMVDGRGQPWWLGTDFGKSQGLSFEVDEEYFKFHGECIQHMVDVVNNKKLVGNASVLDKVTTFEQVLQERLRGAIRGEITGGASAIRKVMSEQPELAKQLFVQK